MPKLNHVTSPATAPSATPLGGARIPTHLDQPLSLEDDDVVRTMRQYGHKGPITREDYIGFIHAKGEPEEWSPEQEADLPEELRDWSQFENMGE
jgi:hypothetical protein